MTTSTQLGTSWPEKTAIVLMTVPVCLLFSTWYHPLIGIPATIIVIWAGWRLAKSTASSPLPSRSALVLIALTALSMTWTSGLGGLFHQEWDHNLGNSLLHDLIDNPWPVRWSTPNGSVALDSNFAWEMLPALVGKLIGWKGATSTAAMIACLSVFLTILLFVRTVGNWRWWLPFVFIFWSGIDLLGWGLRGQFPGLDTPFENWSLPLVYMSHMVSFYMLSWHALPAWLATFLVIGRKIDSSRVLAVWALLIPLAPYSAVGLAPFVVWASLQGDGPLSHRFRRLLTPENILVPLVISILYGPFFLGNQVFGTGAGWFWKYEPPINLSALIKYAAFWLLEILVPAAALWGCGMRDRLFVVAVVVLCLIPFLNNGGVNDWIIHAAVPGLLVLTLYTAKSFLHAANGRARWLLICVFALGAFNPAYAIWRSAILSFTNDAPFEAADVQTFNPAKMPTSWERRFIVSFHSRPLDELPLLNRMISHRNFPNEGSNGGNITP